MSSVHDEASTASQESASLLEMGAVASPHSPRSPRSPRSTKGKPLQSRRSTVTGEGLRALLDDSSDDFDDVVMKLEVVLRANGLWEETQKILHSGESIPDVLVNKAEARMTVDAVEKRAFFEKIKAVSLGDDESASLPTVVVHVDGLDVVHETSTKDGPPSTVGTTLWGIASLPYSLGASLFSSRGKVVHRKLILQDVSCVLKPGRLTLLLGPPASGKTTLLQSIAGKVHQTSHLKSNASSAILYNGYTKRDAPFVLSKMAAYIDQVDTHLAPLTVLETLQFAFDCISGRGNESILSVVRNPEMMKQIIEAIGSKVDIVTRFLGLEGCKNTVVGDDLTKSISGGQRRRVTTGEAWCTSATLHCCDSISTGLDSATTYDIVREMRDFTQVFSYTTLASLLQPAPEVYDMFDDVMLMDNGCIVFHGTRARILEHFQDMGFIRPPRKDVADFLEEVTTPVGRAYVDPNAQRSPPNTTAAFVARWKETPEYKAQQEEIRATKQAHDATDEERNTMTLGKQAYPDVFVNEFNTSWWSHFSLCLERERLLMKRDSSKVVSRIVQTIVVACLNALLYVNLDLNDYHSKISIIFGNVVNSATAAFGGLPAGFEERDVFYRHRDASFFRTSAYVSARLLAELPVLVAEVVVYVNIVYWAVNLTPQAPNYLYFLALSVLLDVTMTQFFHVLDSIFPDLSTAMNFAAFVFTLFILFSGFAVAPENIPVGWLWAYYLNPVSWCFVALVQNEFKSSRYNQGLAFTERDLGDEFLEQGGFPRDPRLMTAAAIALVAFFLLFVGLTTYGLHAFRFAHVRGGVERTEEAENEAGPCGDEVDEDEENIGEEVPHTAGPRRLPSTWRSFSYDKSTSKNGSVITTDHTNVPIRSLRHHDPTHPHILDEDSEYNVELGTYVSSASAMSLAFEPATLAWVDVGYSMDLPTRGRHGEHETLEILHSVSGFAVPGKCMALMGSSGAGKTTLLNVLSQRCTVGHVKGRILVNGHHLDKHSFSRIAAYCEQFDAHAPCSTVLESLEFSARLRLPSNVTSAHRRAVVMDALGIFGLRVIRDRQTRTLSVEERKRVSIAVEIVSSPSILFLDEPTSGLDACAALTVMQAIRSAANTGRTIVCTIHQPSSTIFESFDSLLLLKRGGRTIFFGELGNESSNLVSHLEAMPGAPRLPAGANPAVYMLEVIGGGSTGASRLQVDPAEVWSGSKKRLDMMSEITRVHMSTEGKHKFKLENESRLMLELIALTQRILKMHWRSPEYNVTRVLTAAIFGIMLGSVYWDQLGDDVVEYTTAVEQMASFHFLMMFVGFLCFTTVLPVMEAERPVLYRERSAGMYSIKAYSIVLGLAELPYLSAMCATVTCVFYFTVGLERSWTAFGYFGAYTFLLMTFCTYFGQLAFVASPSLLVAQGIGMSLLCVLASFSGFLKPAGDLGVLEFIYWVSPFHYALEGETVTQFHDSDTEVEFFDPTAGQVTTVSMYDFVTEEFSEGYFSYSHRVYGLIALAALCVSNRVLTYLALKRAHFETR